LTIFSSGGNLNKFRTLTYAVLASAVVGISTMRTPPKLFSSNCPASAEKKSSEIQFVREIPGGYLSRNVITTRKFQATDSAWVLVGTFVPVNFKSDSTKTDTLTFSVPSGTDVNAYVPVNEFRAGTFKPTTRHALPLETAEGVRLFNRFFVALSALTLFIFEMALGQQDKKRSKPAKQGEPIS
jgi:hypothetical protein